MIHRPFLRPFLRPVLAALVPLLIALPAAAQSALDGIMAKKQIQIAIPTDFPPYGFVGTDLKPIGLDVDMANYIGAALGLLSTLADATLTALWKHAGFTSPFALTKP